MLNVALSSFPDSLIGSWESLYGEPLVSVSELIVADSSLEDEPCNISPELDKELLQALTSESTSWASPGLQEISSLHLFEFSTVSWN